MSKKLIIAAISARGYAEAAYEFANKQECTFNIVTLDAFADVDTRKFATQSLVVKLGESGVDEDDFKQKFQQIKIDENCDFIYGSLFDSTPALLAWLSERVNVLGNSAKTMQICRSLGFFELLEDLNIAYPEIQFDAPEQALDWLTKDFFCTGGTHVKSAASLNAGDYFQRKVDGVPVSLLFVADGLSVKVIGYNQQWLAPTADMPYRFAGAVGGLCFAQHVQLQFVEAAQKLTASLGLVGVNSLDAILDGDNLWILELNPRLSATFHLYPNLLQAHLRACAGELIDLPVVSTSKAQLILYADKTLDVSADFIWPDCVADMPYAENGIVRIAENEPICTVFAEAQNAIEAQRLVLYKTKILKRELFHDSK